jgi:hypothetical protein
MMTTLLLDDLLPVALGHDQTASHCPWVQLTRSTTDYPSRRAQAAIALLAGAIDPSAELVDPMFRCDGCSRCLPGGTRVSTAYSDVIYDARAMLVEHGLVPEADQWEANWRRHRNFYGDIGESFSSLEPAESTSPVLFVPGAATLWLDPAAALAAWRLVQRVDRRAVVDANIIDSGFMLRELGLAAMYESERSRLRDHVSSRGYETIIAGTPKVAFEVSRVFKGLPISVISVITLLVDRLASDPDRARPSEASRTYLLHASDYLMRDADQLSLTDRALSAWLGDRYRPENGDRAQWWPAAIERPSTGGNGPLEMQLARNRADQLLEQAPPGELTILTVDPFSRGALTTVVNGRAVVADLASTVESGLEGTEFDV